MGPYSILTTCVKVVKFTCKCENGSWSCLLILDIQKNLLAEEEGLSNTGFSMALQLPQMRRP